MDTRRRTLAPDPSTMNSSHSNPNSRIPMPSSAMKSSGPLRSVSGSGMGMNMNASQNSNGNGNGGGGYGSSQNGGGGRSSVMGMSGGGMGMGMGMGMGRMSIAPSQSQGSDYGGGGGGLGGAARRSTMLPNNNGMGTSAMNGMNGMGMSSAGRGDAGFIGRTPVGRQSTMSSSAGRRSSAFAPSTSRQSLAPLAFSSTLTTPGGGSSQTLSSDPRQIRSQPYLQHARDSLSHYLSSTRCPTPIGPKTLYSPTTKEFQTIFKFLIVSAAGLGWEAYQWGVTGNKSFEADVVQIMGDLRYPSVAGVSKTALGAPGSPTNWPAILAMLHWISELAKTLHQWSSPLETSDPLIRPLSDYPDSELTEIPDVVDRIEHEFFSSAYRAWMDGDEGFVEVRRVLEDRFATMESRFIEDQKSLTEEKKREELNLNMRNSQGDPLDTAKKEEYRLMQDKANFVKWIEQAKEKVKSAQVKVDQGKNARSHAEAEMAKLVAEKADLERQVAEQNLSPDEVARMNNDRATLTESIRDLQIEVGKMTKDLGDQEIAVTRRMDEIDSLVSKYNHGKAVIGLNSSSIQQQYNVDFNVDVNMASSDLTAVNIVSQRIKESVQPGLTSFGDGMRMEENEQTRQKIELVAKLDALKTSLEQRKHQVQTLEYTLAGVEKKADLEKQRVKRETEQLQERVLELEADVGAMSMSSEQELLAVDTELERMAVARAEMIHQANSAREKLVQEITFHTEQIIKAREYATEKVNELKTFIQHHA